MSQTFGTSGEVLCTKGRNDIAVTSEPSVYNFPPLMDEEEAGGLMEEGMELMFPMEVGPVVGWGE